MTHFHFGQSVQRFLWIGSRSGRHGRQLCLLVAARAQHLLLIENYRYTIPRHSVEHAGKFDRWKREQGSGFSARWREQGSNFSARWRATRCVRSMAIEPDLRRRPILIIPTSEQSCTNRFHRTSLGRTTRNPKQGNRSFNFTGSTHRRSRRIFELQETK